MMTVRQAVPETARGGRTTALILATTAFAVNFWAWALLSPLGPTYRELLGPSPAAVSVLVAVPVIVGSLGRIVLGGLTDRYGGRAVFSATSLLGTVPVMFLAFAEGYPALLAGGLPLGLTGATFAIGVPYVNAWFPRGDRLGQGRGNPRGLVGGRAALPRPQTDLRLRARAAAAPRVPHHAMVWYIPPLSPVVDVLAGTGHDGEDADNLFGAIDALRIPIGYLAGLFTAGDPGPVRDVLRRLAAMRSYMRRINLGREPDESIATAAGMTGERIEEMYRLLAIAAYGERYVIPKAHTEQGAWLEESASGCSLDYEGGPGMSGPFGESSGTPAPVAVENFQALRDRQSSGALISPEDRRGRINLLNWDGKGVPEGLFPDKNGERKT